MKNNIVQLNVTRVNRYERNELALNTRVDIADLMKRIHNAADKYVDRVIEFDDETNISEKVYIDVIKRFLDFLENDMNAGIV